MKKLLFVAILGTLVACGESSTSTTTDSTAVTVDSTVVATPDSAVVADSTVSDSAKVDSAK